VSSCTGTDHDLLLALTDPKGVSHDRPRLEGWAKATNRAVPALPEGGVSPVIQIWTRLAYSTLSTLALLAGVPSWTYSTCVRYEYEYEEWNVVRHFLEVMHACILSHQCILHAATKQNVGIVYSSSCHFLFVFKELPHSRSESLTGAESYRYRECKPQSSNFSIPQL
jgi:hypothetical protein